MNETPEMSSELNQGIEKAILDSEVEVVPGSGRNYEISVISASFEGSSLLVKRPRQVYAVITDLSGDDVNAPVQVIHRLQASSS